MIKINPVYQKELKTSVRSFRTFLILFSYNGLLSLFGLFAFYVTFENQSRRGGTLNYSSILDIYAIIIATEFCLVLFVIPALTAASIAGEREKQTLEILLTTKLSPLSIVLGKLASSISMMVLLAFSSLPILSLVFSIGGITLRDFFEFMLLVVVTAVFIGSIGIFYSTFFKKTTSATVSTYGTLLILGIGTIGIVWAIHILLQMKIDYIGEDKLLYQNADVGNWLLILMVNPAVTCFAMIENQIGTGQALTSFMEDFGTISLKVQEHWFGISILVQLVISALLILSSARLLNPLRKNCSWKR